MSHRKRRGKYPNAREWPRESLRGKESHRLEHWRAVATEKSFSGFLSISAHSTKLPVPSPLDAHLSWGILCFHKWQVHIPDICLQILLILCGCPDTRSTVMQFLGAPEVLTNWQIVAEQRDYMSLKNMFIWSLKVLSSYICHGLFYCKIFQMNGKEQRNTTNTHNSQILAFRPISYIFLKK